MVNPKKTILQKKTDPNKHLQPLQEPRDDRQRSGYLGLNLPFFPAKTVFAATTIPTVLVALLLGSRLTSCKNESKWQRAPGSEQITTGLCLHLTTSSHR